MVATPRLDALDDEELLAGLDQVEAPGFAHQLLPGAGLGDAPLEVGLLGAQRRHLRLPVAQLGLGVQVARGRLPVEKGDDGEAAESEQASRLRAHADAFGAGGAAPTTVARRRSPPCRA
jgi:hypothetical protein